MSLEKLKQKFSELQNKISSIVAENIVIEKKSAAKLKEFVPSFVSEFIEIETCKHCGKIFYSAFTRKDIDEVKGSLLGFRICCQGMSDAIRTDMSELLRRLQQYEKCLEAIASLEKSGVGKRFKSKCFENYIVTAENKPLFEKCREYSERFEEFSEEGKGLLLIGSCGVGKTHLAVSILKQIAEKGKSVMFGSMVEIIQNLKSSFDRKNETANESDIIGMLSEIDLLVIDDLGKENISNYVKMIAYQVINRRYCEMKPTIITTNNVSEELIKKYDEATISRLIESNIVVAISPEVKDFRKKISRENQRLI